MAYKRNRVFLPQGNASDLEYSLYLASESTFSFGKLCLPDFNKSEPSIFHFDFADNLDERVTEPLFSIVARGHAKTTLCKANIVRDLCFTAETYLRLSKMSNSHLKGYWERKHKERRAFGPFYYIWIAKSQTDSISNSKYIKDNLTDNPLILKYFGNMKGPTWNREYIETRDGDVLECGSNLKGVRGKNISTKRHGAIRITRVYLDDAENEENTKTFSSRNDIKTKVFAAIIPAIEHKPYCRLIVTGTPVHFDSMIQNIIDDVDVNTKNGTMDKFPFKVIIYKATQPTMRGGVLWDDYVGRDKLDRQKEMYKAVGKIALYYQEYELEVAGSEVATWTRNHFKIHNGIYVRKDEKNYLQLNEVLYPCNIFLGCDPATDIETRTSDYSVVSAIAVLQDNTRYSLGYERHLSIPTIGLRDEHTKELIGRKGIVDYLFEMYDRFHADGATVENVAMTRSVWQAINAIKIRKNKFDYVIDPISPAGKNKHNKIFSYFSPMFSDRIIYYRDTDDDLINETIRFGPKMAHDDTIEAFYFANKNAYPPDYEHEKEKVTVDYWAAREAMIENRAHYVEAMQGKLPWFLQDQVRLM